jgi:tetratricopeptide (TPR) repeat protein
MKKMLLSAVILFQVRGMTIRRWLLVFAASAVVLGCMPPGAVRIDNVPMYGQPEIARPEALKKADEDFIKQAASGFGSREEASKAWWSQGEKFMSEGNLDFAMRRYNQSWLLNPKNYQPYWGFARVMLEQGKIDRGIEFLEKAEELNDDPYQKVALLSDMGTVYTLKGKQIPAYFEKANVKFAESIKLDAAYPDAWRRWAFSLYEQGRYKEAWAKVAKAESLNAKPFPPQFLSELESKLPRPK